MSTVIDWSKQEQYPEDRIECTCGVHYRSHAKGVIEGGRFVIHTRRECPGCRQTVDHVRAVRSEPEYHTIGGKKP